MEFTLITLVMPRPSGCRGTYIAMARFLLLLPYAIERCAVDPNQRCLAWANPVYLLPCVRFQITSCQEHVYVGAHFYSLNTEEYDLK